MTCLIGSLRHCGKVGKGGKQTIQNHLCREAADEIERLRARLAKAERLLRATVAPDEIERLRTAARAVIERWETPLWKDTEPTAAVIARLHAAVEGIATDHPAGDA